MARKLLTSSAKASKTRTQRDGRAVQRDSRKTHWLSEYAKALLIRSPGTSKRDVAESIVCQAKRSDGRDFRISVRSLEVWRRGVTEPVRVPTTSARAIGRRIAGLRRELNWTRAQLSHVSGIAEATLAGYEAGSRVPVRDNLVRLSLALFEPMALLLFGKRSLLPAIIRGKNHPRSVSAAMRRRASLANPAHWLPIKEAVAIDGRSLRTWRWLASKYQAQSLAQKRTPRNGHGRPTWWVHRSIVKARTQGSDASARKEAVRIP